MLNRRHLRIKVLHALYAFIQSGNDNLQKGEQELLTAIEKVNELYITLLSFFPEIADMLDKELEQAKTKFIPTAEDLKPNKKFVEGKIIEFIRINNELKLKTRNKKVLWNSEQDLVRNIYRAVIASAEYNNYLKTEYSIKEEQDFLCFILETFLLNYEPFIYYLEEKNIYWQDDFSIAGHAVVKTIKSFTQNSNEYEALSPLYRDEEDDRRFIVELFRKTILNQKDLLQMISEKTENWELERIALMDIILMQMAISEMLNFESIPLKVSLNEYIDISKDYSTPKSKLFINGILDKLVIDFKRNGKINKTGRGLIE